MAFNSEDLTINFESLMSVPVADRVVAAQQSLDFSNALISQLTPIQIAKAFPDYYLRKLPDISNFITSNIQSKLNNRGQSWNQTGGGNNGQTQSYYQQEASPNASNAAAASSSPAAKSTAEQVMEKAGITENVSDNKIVAKETATETQKSVIDFANRWGISPQAAAGVFKVESGITNSATNGGFHGVFQLGTKQVPQFTEAAGFGKLDASQFRKLSISDQLKVMDEYYKFWKVKPEFFTGDPKTDTSKMWALQLAPGKAQKLDYTNPNTQIVGPGQAEIISAGGAGGPVTVESSANSLTGGTKFLNDASVEQQATKATEEIKGPQAIKNVSSEISENPYEFWKARNPNKAILEHDGVAISKEQLTTAMMAAKKFEAEHPNKRVEIYGPGGGYDVPGSPLGGNRNGRSQHLKAGATDWAIYDIDPKTGEKLKNHSGAYGNYANKPNSPHGGVDPEGYALYHEFAQDQELARVYKASQGKKEYSNWGVREGGLFSDVKWDFMHTDIGGKVNPKTGISTHVSPIGRGSVAEGYSEKALRLLGIDPNSSQGQRLMTGVSERFGTGDKLVESAIASYGESDIVPPKSESQSDTKSTAEPAPVPSDIVPPKDSVKSFRTGGSPELQDDENLTAVGSDGKPKFKFNSGEGLYVKPESDEYADGKLEDLSNRVDEMNQKQQNKPKGNAKKVQKTYDNTQWRKNVAAAHRPVSPSHSRAINRSKLFPEGHHFGRGAVSSRDT